jgi:hypothetical protein
VRTGRQGSRGNPPKNGWCPLRAGDRGLSEINLFPHTSDRTRIRPKSEAQAQRKPLSDWTCVRKPRLTGFPTGHLTAYAYQEVVSLVLAQWGDVLTGMAIATFQLSPQGDGSFNVEMTTAGGQFRTIPGFSCEREAAAWIVQTQRLLQQANPRVNTPPRDAPKRPRMNAGHNGSLAVICTLRLPLLLRWAGREWSHRSTTQASPA